MKKLALAIGLGAYIVFGAGSGSLAAYRADNTAGVAAIGNTSPAAAVIGTGVRLLSLNLALYPDTASDSAVTVSAAAHGDQERADMAQASTARAETERMLCDGDICPVP
jgi:hypothetical protein